MCYSRLQSHFNRANFKKYVVSARLVIRESESANGSLGNVLRENKDNIIEKIKDNYYKSKSL